MLGGFSMKYNIDSGWLTRTAVLLALTLVIQSLKMPQFVTGPAVNAMLLLSVIFVSTASGIFIGLLTPLIAYLVGIMPFGPAVPFIMAGNLIYVALFGFFRSKQEYIALIGAAIGKYAVLSASVYYIIPLVIGGALKPPLVLALTSTQLITALVGGIAAIFVSRLLAKVLKK
jgi:hypothetical protein